MVLNYIHGRANVISYHYQDRVTTYNAYSWDDFRAKLRVPFETDFAKYGVVTGTATTVGTTNLTHYVPAASGNLKNSGDTIRWEVFYLGN